MKKLLLLACILPILNGVLAQSSETNLRGQVRTIEPVSKSAVPMTKITVELFKKGPGTAAWVLVAATTTDQNGFYYFNGIATGKYFIQVNKQRNYDIAVVPVNEKSQQFQDLPLLVY